MDKLKMIIHSDEQLQIGSAYFSYHVRMYVETLLWLQNNQGNPGRWDTIRNSVIEAHLVHARILINFLCNLSSRYDSDVLATHYFHDSPTLYKPINDGVLKNNVGNIGNRLVHLTTKPMPKLKSEEEWQVGEIAIRLTPIIKKFLGIVRETRFSKIVKDRCLENLAKVSPPEIHLSIMAST